MIIDHSRAFFGRGPLLVLGLALGCTGTDEDAAPVITLNGNAVIEIEYGDDFVDPGVTVTDDVDTNLQATVTGNVDTTTLGEYTLTYDVADSDGNAADTVIRTVRVVDTTAPVLTLNGDNPLVITEGGVFTDPGATATDNADGALTPVVTGAVDATMAGAYTLTYTATDSSGNTASVDRDVEVVFDGQLIVTSSGPDLVLLGLRADGTLIERGTASFGSELVEYNTNHVVFGVAQVPGTNTVYATSFNECGSRVLPTDGCWGNARIDRFTYDATGIQHEGVATLIQLPLRVLRPSFDAATGNVDVVVLNQGTTAQTITTVTPTSEPLPDGVTLTSSCDGVTLQPGDPCTVVLGTKAGLEPVGSIDLTYSTDALDYRTNVYYDTELDSHRALGLGTADYNYYYYNSIDMPGCTGVIWEPEQSGGCAPTALAVSPDGTRVYVNEDNLDTALVYAVENDGTLRFLSQADNGSTSRQGIATNGTHVYNGSRAFSVDNDTLVGPDDYTSGGNATEVVTVAGEPRLVSTLNNSTLGIYDLTDPLVPAEIAIFEPSLDGARYQHHDATLGRFAVVDQQRLTTASFDGSAFTELDTLSIPIDVGPCKECDYSGNWRFVQMTADGTHAVASAFINVDDAKTLGLLPYRGVVRSFSLDASGAIAEVDSLTFPGMARSLRFVDTPTP